jgi:hypothetical protein
MEDKYYNDTLAKYTRTVHLAIKISRLAADRQVEDKVFWASVLYTKICVTGLSLLILAPENEIANKKITHWDFSSLFSLTRNLIECHQTFFYLCVDNVADDELKARRKLFNLHDYKSRAKLFSYSPKKLENEEIEKLVVEELLNTKYFKNLNEKQQKHFLKGDNAFFISREEIEEKMGKDKNEFKLIYNLFSNNIHSFPMGFYGMIDSQRGIGEKSDIELKYSSLALEIAERNIRDASNNMTSFFPDILDNLTVDERDFL